MIKLDEMKQNQYDVMFFTVKILAIFFCAAPLFGHFFNNNVKETVMKVDFSSVLISLLILVVITLMWMTMNYWRKKSLVSLIIEIAMFYGISLASILYSGGYQSYYKFMFIFPVVSYTIERGIKIGMSIAGLASCTILLMDIIMYNEPGVNKFFESDIALSAIFIVVAWILGFFVRFQRQHIDELREFANIDGLTQVYNHRYFHEIFKAKYDESIKNDTPISLIMMDIDYFKTYNDIFGHQQGDVVLREIAKILKENINKGDIVCRYGGEEFIIILPDTAQKEALITAEKLRKIIYEYEFFGENALRNGVLTVSVGVAERLGPNDPAVNIIKRVDMALYRAKFFRKNRVEIYTNSLDQFDGLDKSDDNSIVSVKSLITIINSRDCYTYHHIERVRYYCERFAEYLKLSNEDMKTLLYGAYLHDLGKINISKETLMSTKKLSQKEWEEIKKHPADGADIVRQLGNLDNIVDLVLQHHEKYDGTGYPAGLKGEEISYLARILTIADSFDAMTANRPYKEAMAYEDAFQEILDNRGTQFDPVLAEQFVKAMSE